MFEENRLLWKMQNILAVFFVDAFYMANVAMWNLLGIMKNKSRWSFLPWVLQANTAQHIRISFASHKISSTDRVRPMEMPSSFIFLQKNGRQQRIMEIEEL